MYLRPRASRRLHRRMLEIMKYHRDGRNLYAFVVEYTLFTSRAHVVGGRHALFVDNCRRMECPPVNKYRRIQQ